MTDLLFPGTRRDLVIPPDHVFRIDDVSSMYQATCKNAYKISSTNMLMILINVPDDRSRFLHVIKDIADIRRGIVRYGVREAFKSWYAPKHFYETNIQFSLNSELINPTTLTQTVANVASGDYVKICFNMEKFKIIKNGIRHTSTVYMPSEQQAMMLQLSM